MEKPVRRMHKHSRLPRTSRVNDKILDYYTKFGKDRDLQKFMRLYSPAGSQNSQKGKSPIQTTTTPITTNSSSSCCTSEDGATLRRLFRESAHEFIASQSLPNMELQDNEINVPIRLKGVFDKPNETSQSTSSKCIETPEKTSQGQCKATQTPDSVMKNHKRLEWDSIGDVGYNKSMSTSNISLFERTLLKELFQDSPAATAALSKEIQTNASEGDLRNLKQDTISKLTEHNSPPLACSTFADTKRNIYKGGARPKCINRSTCTSLRKKFEMSTQTAMPRTEVASREIHVNMASTPSSFVGSTTTPSSFEYYTSSCSTTTSNDNGCPKSHKVSQCPLHLARKVIAERNRCNDEPDDVKLQEIHNTLRQALIDNKENNAASALLNSPQLDLGIQLLCSLIDAKSLNNKQKKQLIRNIVKRISVMSINDDALSKFTNIMSESTSTRSDTSCSKRSKLYPQTKPFKEITRTTSTSGKESTSSKNLERKSSPPETSGKALTKLAELNTNAALELEQHAAEVPKAITSKGDGNEKPEKCDKELQIDILNHLAISVTSLERATVAPPITPIAAVAKNSSSATTVSSTPSSRELTIQKALNELKSSKSTDGEQASMREWLNPLTQSEIEYEERKRASAEIAETQMKQMRAKEEEKQKPNRERNVQLNWIDTEIKRLESLRFLLLKDNNVSSDKHKNKSDRLRNKDKIYDTVCVSSLSFTSSSSTSSTSAVLSGSAKRAVQEIEVIIEESNEDVVNLIEPSKHTKERKREIQIYFDKSRTFGEQFNARFRKIKETTTTNEEQILQSDKTPTQRSKIDTPVPQESTDSESVRSFAQQRKREFLTHYKNARKSHTEALQQLRQLENEEKHLTRLKKKAKPPNTNNNAPQSLSPLPVTQLKSTSSHISYNISADCTWVSHTRTTYHPEGQSSASSSLGVSSDMSVPMVLDSSSSTSTTTHQYDDVAAAVHYIGAGIQTSNSLLCTHPIFGPLRAPQHTEKCHTEVQPACVQVKPKGIAYVIQFDEHRKSKSTSTSSGSATGMHSDSSSNSNTGNKPEQEPTLPQLTLQDHLERAKPEFVAHSMERKAILNQIQALRQNREREMRNIIENASMTSIDEHLTALPPPPTTQVRVFATKEMKALTNKHFVQLPEVLEKQLREREERRRRGNRVMRDVFNRRLQRRVRNGQLSLNHSRTVI